VQAFAGLNRDTETSVTAVTMVSRGGLKLLALLLGSLVISPCYVVRVHLQRSAAGRSHGMWGMRCRQGAGLACRLCLDGHTADRQTHSPAHKLSAAATGPPSVVDDDQQAERNWQRHIS
jgi:hypothetical protein